MWTDLGLEDRREETTERGPAADRSEAGPPWAGKGDGGQRSGRQKPLPLASPPAGHDLAGPPPQVCSFLEELDQTVPALHTKDFSAANLQSKIGPLRETLRGSKP